MTLRVSKVFEGEEEVLTHDADTLSRFDAEQIMSKVVLQPPNLGRQLGRIYIVIVTVKASPPFTASRPFLGSNPVFHRIDQPLVQHLGRGDLYALGVERRQALGQGGELLGGGVGRW